MSNELTEKQVVYDGTKLRLSEVKELFELMR